MGGDSRKHSEGAEKASRGGRRAHTGSSDELVIAEGAGSYPTEGRMKGGVEHPSELSRRGWGT